MAEFVRAFFSFILVVLGTTVYPTSTQQWYSVEPWIEKPNGVFIFSAKNQNIIQECKEDPSKVLIFPQIIHGVHQLYLDGKLVLSTGDETFQKSSAFYNRGIVSCAVIENGSELTWVAYSYTYFFARFNEFPNLKSNSYIIYFFDVIANLLSIGALIILAIISLTFYRQRVQLNRLLTLSVGALMFSIYTLMSASNIFPFSVSMLVAHKIADFAGWSGICLYFYFFYLQGLLNKKLFYIHVMSTLLAFIFIFSGTNGDIVQFGTNFPMIFTFVCFANLIFRSVHNISGRELNRIEILKLTSMFIFVLTFTNDLLNIVGLIDTYLMFSMGVTSAFFYLLAQINQEVEMIYNERNNLVTNLEKIVEVKTQSLIKESEEKYQLNKNFTEVAQRTAHDIRSPLTTINYVAKKIHQTNPEDGQSLMLMSKQLIDIANDLLNYKKNQESSIHSLEQNQNRFQNDSPGVGLNKSQAIQQKNESGSESIKRNQIADDLYLQRFQLGQTPSKQPVINKPVDLPGLPKFHSDEVYQILTEVVEMKKIELEQSDLRISVYNDLERPGSIQLDRSQFMRIISNVINNANEAIQIRPGMISISLANHLIDDVEYIAIEIRDNGPGFPAKVIERLGQSGNTSGKENGHGIGLASAYETMQSWGARLAVSNIKPTGAKVSLVFIFQ